MSRLSLLFPHQLFEHNPVLKKGQSVCLVEEHLFFRQFTFHKQKLVYHRASMKTYQAWLEAQGYTVMYVEAHDQGGNVRNLFAQLKARGVNQVDCVDPVDDWLRQRITLYARKAEIKITWQETPMFLNRASDLNDFFRSDKKKYFQTEFYIAQRKSRNILLEAGQPMGGKWSFDAENRKRYPAKKPVPVISSPLNDMHYQEALAYVSLHFPHAPGDVGATPVYPHTFEASRKWLQLFLEYRFQHFGDYEDAIVVRENFLHHSVLTPMLNIGLLTPPEVVQSVLTYGANHNIPLNSIEGFIRQVIGWREFIRGVYEVKGSYQRTRNHWNFTRKIPASFYDGSTGIEPVDTTIKKILKTGYVHHIERLMILGNFMFLCGFHPDEVYRWFMELFIDAYDWVMVPNVYGMSQFADGGLMATKPYISGSNYILKMSDYKRGTWCEVWDALYWMFIYDYAEEFSRNPRMSMMVRQLQKMDAKKLASLKATRDNFINQL